MKPKPTNHSLEPLNNSLFKVLETQEMANFRGGKGEDTFDETFTQEGECYDTILTTDGTIESTCVETDCPDY